MIVDDIKTIKYEVEKIMIKFPKTRNSDTLLIFKVLEDLKFANLEDNVYNIKKEDLYKLPSFASIIRIRQKIQNDEKQLLPTDDDVLKQRGMLKEEMDRIHSWYDDGW